MTVSIARQEEENVVVVSAGTLCFKIPCTRSISITWKLEACDMKVMHRLRTEYLSLPVSQRVPYDCSIL